MKSKETSERRILIIGYGNPLRADDGVGWEAARRLGELVDDESIEILALHQLTPELAEPASTADLIIFIDASHEGRPGSWKCERIEISPSSTNPLAHQLIPTSLLAYAQAIFQTRPTALLLSVAGESFTYREQLTPGVEAALPQVMKHVLEQIARFRRNPEETYA